jgi:Putative transmembrane protein (PGPGW)
VRNERVETIFGLPGWNAILIVVFAIVLIAAIVGVWSIGRWPKAIKPHDMVLLVRRNMRRIWVLLAGTTIILVGIIISPLPGPGLSVLGPLGLAIIATEFVWAKRLRDKMLQRTTGVRGHLDMLAAKTSLWILPLVWVGYWAGVTLVALYDPVPPWIVWPLASMLFTPFFFWTYRTVALYRARRRQFLARSNTPAPVRPIEGRSATGLADS